MLVMRVLQGETIRSDIRDGNETGFERIVRNIFATFESSNGIDPHTCVKKRKSTDIITSLKFISQKMDKKLNPFILGKGDNSITNHINTLSGKVGYPP